MIPNPRSFETDDQVFYFDRPLSVHVVTQEGEKLVNQTADLFVRELQQFGFDCVLAEGTERASIELRLNSEASGAVPDSVDSRPSGELLPSDENYRAEIGPSKILVSAGSAEGIFYATRTLLSAAGSEKKIAVGSLSDGPRYSWRGVHLDVARHFYPVESVKRFIDLLALHKMNVFHWHLTEDQGWRIEIDAFPKLTDISAWRTKDGDRYGGFYTKDEVREVLAYAKERFVTVVPEIEMPGHAVAALAAYPELSCTGGPFDVETEWGIFDDVYCAGNEETFRFLERVLDEVIELFPSEFFHIGGDECPKKKWKECPKCQERIKQEGLKSEDELQSWFVRRASEYLSERGRRLVGWDEILEGGLAPGATVMSWRGTEGGIRAAQMGHDVVMSPTSHCYLDYKQSEDEDEPGAWFAPTLDLETTYSYEPTPKELTAQEAQHVLGVQANVWSEKMPTFKQVEYMTFPRLCAVAEVAWSSSERDFAGFRARLQTHQRLLDRLGVGYRGSDAAEPVLPSDDDKARYAQACKDRDSQKAAAY